MSKFAFEGNMGLPFDHSRVIRAKAENPNYGYRRIHAKINSERGDDKPISTRQVRKYLGIGAENQQG